MGFCEFEFLCGMVIEQLVLGLAIELECLRGQFVKHHLVVPREIAGAAKAQFMGHRGDGHIGLSFERPSCLVQAQSP